jgi:hypothetical protein
MPRKGARDPAKEQYWRNVLDEWRVSEESAAVFCRRHGYKYYLFQDWRRVVAQRDAERAAAVTKRRSNKARRTRKHSNDRLADFVPARLIETPPAPPSVNVNMEVVLRCGMIVRITSECRPDFVSSVVAALENRSC